MTPAESTTPERRPTALVYLRSAGKDERGGSLDEQRRAIRRYAETHGLSLGSEYVDTPTSMSRP